uniref:Uncharacterized protein n=1 Tax=Physcomitrium patens TaxID=3218 RepID=A0A2K1INX1_PHYPA|nr:hypothetical protein PHYPA_027274 [Physcomitrium patens]
MLDLALGEVVESVGLRCLIVTFHHAQFYMGDVHEVNYGADCFWPECGKQVRCYCHFLGFDKDFPVHSSGYSIIVRSV